MHTSKSSMHTVCIFLTVLLCIKTCMIKNVVCILIKVVGKVKKQYAYFTKQNACWMHIIKIVGKVKKYTSKSSMHTVCILKKVLVCIKVRRSKMQYAWLKISMHAGCILIKVVGKVKKQYAYFKKQYAYCLHTYYSASMYKSMPD